MSNLNPLLGFTTDDTEVQLDSEQHFSLSLLSVLLLRLHCEKKLQELDPINLNW
jgi:hypothetical protein